MSAAGRTPPAPAWRGPAAAVFGMLMAGTAACGGGSPAPKASVPAGFQRVHAGPVSFAVPPGWRPEWSPQGWSAAHRLLDAGGSVTHAQAGVITSVPQTDDVHAVATAAWAGTLINARSLRRGPGKRVAMPGAGKAFRVDYTYTERSPDKPLPARGMDLSLVYGEKKACTLRVTGLQSRLTSVAVDQIVKSVSVDA